MKSTSSKKPIKLATVENPHNRITSDEIGYAGDCFLMPWVDKSNGYESLIQDSAGAINKRSVSINRRAVTREY